MEGLASARMLTGAQKPAGKKELVGAEGPADVEEVVIIYYKH